MSTRHLNHFQQHFDGLVQDCSNSIANALELLQPCTKPSIYQTLSQLCVSPLPSSWPWRGVQEYGYDENKIMKKPETTSFRFPYFVVAYLIASMRNFKSIFLNEKIVYLDSNFTEICSQSTLSQSNGLAPGMRQASICTKDGLVFWRMYI